MSHDSNFSITSQCPPLSGPIRFSLPVSRRFLICLVIALLEIPIRSASPSYVQVGSAARILNIFRELFRELFREPFCGVFCEPSARLPPILAVDFGRQMTMRKRPETSSKSGFLSPFALQSFRRSVLNACGVSAIKIVLRSTVRTIRSPSRILIVSTATCPRTAASHSCSFSFNASILSSCRKGRAPS